MKQGSLEKRILQGLVDYLNDLYPGEIRLVQLFGSRARGDARQDSDYDVLIALPCDIQEFISPLFQASVRYVSTPGSAQFQT
ncbi:nucleotidyltransferase domain-containing protein [Calderihabitans maritimus]|nr:nucleotidyltransferase domain-containing protein [Calderihabitans maritimus]